MLRGPKTELNYLLAKRDVWAKKVRRCLMYESAKLASGYDPQKKNLVFVLRKSTVALINETPIKIQARLVS